MVKSPIQGPKLHIPVLGAKILSLLDISPDGVYFDGTIGAGGHAALIIQQLTSQGQYIGVDRDDEAISHCKKRFSVSPIHLSFYKESYHQIKSILSQDGTKQVNGILLDLGFSSLQLDNYKRGFSFQIDSNLDMRFDQSQFKTAGDILNNLNHKELADVIFKYGEERRSRAIARNIVKHRPLTCVFDLVEAVRVVTPPKHRNRILARVFQAIRIKVNNELEYLNTFLSKFIDYLIIGGRIAIISFHSLEDRQVKHAFKYLSQNGRLKILTPKPIIASADEILNNSRSKSAKLRVAERAN